MTDDFTSRCPTCSPYGLVEGNTKEPEALWFHGIHGKSMVNPVKMFTSNRQWGVFWRPLSPLWPHRVPWAAPHWAAHRHGSVDPWRPSRRFRLWDGKNGSIHQIRVVSHDLSRKTGDFHGDLLIKLGTKNYGSGMQWLGNMTQNGNAQVDWQFYEKAWIWSKTENIPWFTVKWESDDFFHKEEPKGPEILRDPKNLMAVLWQDGFCEDIGYQAIRSRVPRRPGSRCSGSPRVSLL